MLALILKKKTKKNNLILLTITHILPLCYLRVQKANYARKSAGTRNLGLVGSQRVPHKQSTGLIPTFVLIIRVFRLEEEVVVRTSIKSSMAVVTGRPYIQVSKAQWQSSQVTGSSSSSCVNK